MNITGQNLRKIVKTFGEKHQLTKFQEELLELTIAIQDFLELPDQENAEKMTEEFADVKVMSLQFPIIIRDEFLLKIDEIIERKVDRILKRIENQEIETDQAVDMKIQKMIIALKVGHNGKS